MNVFEQLHRPIDRIELDNDYWLRKAGRFFPGPALLDRLGADSRMLRVDTLVSAGHDTFRIMPAKNEPIRNGGGPEALAAWESDPSATLVAERAQFTLPEVWWYCTAVMHDIRVPFRLLWPNIYYSRPGSGFTRHWDNHENFIVGLKGRKRFVVAPNKCIAYPEQNAANFGMTVKGFEGQIEEEITASTLPGMVTVDVGPGECIFIPRGWWHEAFSLDQDSVTLTLAIWTCTWADLLAAGGIEVPSSATALALRTPVSLATARIPENLGLSQASRNALTLVRAQVELKSIARITKRWEARLEAGAHGTADGGCGGDRALASPTTAGALS